MNSNIIFLIIDSFRSDKFFGVKKTSITPNIDYLIKNGTYFSEAITSSDATILSWSSIYTGRFPFKTGIRSSRFNKLDKDIPTIFDYLTKNNYAFYSFTPTFSETIGLFPNFKNENNIYDFTETLDSGLGDKILSLLSSKKMQSPWFLNIHLLDLHYPLLVPSGFDDEQFGFSKYERIISSIDDWIGKFIKKIDFENTILVVTSDHGTNIRKLKKNKQIFDFEDDGISEIRKKRLTNKIPTVFKPIKDKIFFSIESRKKIQKSTKISNYELTPYEKRSLLSGHYSIDHDLFDEKLRVPLLFYGKNIDKDKIFSKQVRLVDILPTICYLTDISFDYNNADGKNLLPLKNEEIFQESPAYIESNPLIDKKSNDVIGIRTSKFKYFRDSESQNERIHLFDLSNDYYEEHNIASTNKTKVLEMEKILQDFLNNFNKAKPKNDDLTSDEIENELRKMGYV